MKKGIVFLIIVFISLSCTKNQDKSKSAVDAAQSEVEIVVYKSPSCGCCTKWTEHMMDNGFKISEKPVDDLQEVKNRLGVPADKRSCHTAVAGNYVFEGHIPASSIKRFLKEKSNKKGLVVPDMPAGSPGMEYGNHKAKFNVYSFDSNGETKIFEKF